MHQFQCALLPNLSHTQLVCNFYLPRDPERRQLGSWREYVKGSNTVSLPAEGAAWATQIQLVDDHSC